jgi:hypothetical protein
MFENSGLRRIFESERQAVAGGWRKYIMRTFMIVLLTKYLCYQIRMRRTGHVTCMGQRKNSYKMLVRKPGGKRSLGRLMYTWKDNIKMYL